MPSITEGSLGVVRAAIASLTAAAAGVAPGAEDWRSVSRASRSSLTNSLRDRPGSCGQSLRMSSAMRARTPRSPPSVAGAAASTFARSGTASDARA